MTVPAEHDPTPLPRPLRPVPALPPMPRRRFLAGRHRAIPVALVLVTASGVANLGVMIAGISRTSNLRPSEAVVGAGYALAMLAFVQAPALIMFLAGWLATWGRVAPWVLLMSALGFAPLTVVLNADVLLSDSSTAAIGYVFYAPILLGWAGLTWFLVWAIGPKAAPVPTTYQ